MYTFCVKWSISWCERGLYTLRWLSKERNDDVVALLDGKESVCRDPTPTDGESVQQLKRSSRDVFDFKQKCIFCRWNIDVCDNQKNPDRQVPFRIVCDINIIHTIRGIAANWDYSLGEEVSWRLCTKNGQVTAEAWYYHNYYAMFCRIGFRRPTYQLKVFSRASLGNPSFRGGYV